MSDFSKWRTCPIEPIQLDTERYTFTPSRASALGAKPILSVIIPMYGCADTLEQALDSLSAQSLGRGFGDIEFICVDDSSPDNALEIARNYPDARVAIVEHEKNLGYGAAMNDGIASASGDWIAILEPDDYIVGNMYKPMIEVAESWEDDGAKVDVVKQPYYRAIRPEGMEKGSSNEKLAECSYRHRVPQGMLCLAGAGAVLSQNNDAKRYSKSAHLLRHHPSIWSAIYSRAFLDGANVYDKRIRFVEHPGSGWADNEFFYKTMLMADGIVYSDEPHYCYREETEAERSAFILKNQDVPLTRWQAMQDILDSVDAPEDIQRAHISRGFTYLDGVSSVAGIDEKLLQGQKEAMFERMDATLVDAENELYPGWKKDFADYIGKPFSSSAATLEYGKSLIRATGYTIRNNGPAFTARQIADYVTKSVKR